MTMSRSTILLVLLFLLWAAPAVGAEDLRVPQVTPAPSLDGRVDEPAWKSAVALPVESVAFPPPKEPTASGCASRSIVVCSSPVTAGRKVTTPSRAGVTTSQRVLSLSRASASSARSIPLMFAGEREARMIRRTDVICSREVT